MSIVDCGEIEEMDGRLKGQGRCLRSAMKGLLVRLIVYLFIVFSGKADLLAPGGPEPEPDPELPEDPTPLTLWHVARFLGTRR